MPLVITSCTNRKSRAPAPELRASNLPLGRAENVAAIWARRAAGAGGRVPAASLYQGRSFREAEQAATAIRGRLAILSAGMGLVEAEARVPAYALTVAPDGGDYVLARLQPAGTVQDWWAQLRRAGQGRALEEIAREDMVLVAAGRLYLEMIAEEVGSLAPEARERLRIFTAAPASHLPGVYQGLVMPYDSRLDGPDSARPGTLSDFAQRALHDFSLSVLGSLPNGSASQHSAGVARRIGRWRAPRRNRGEGRSDPEIRTVIADHWQAVGGRSTAMLRLLRGDLGIACEEGRFRRLFAAVVAERSA